MKKLLHVTLIALSLATVFASASLANTTSNDEYEFTALYNDVLVEFPAKISHEDCNTYARLQNKIDLRLDVLQYDQDISKAECSHPDADQKASQLKVNRILEEISFDG